MQRRRGLQRVLVSMVLLAAGAAWAEEPSKAIVDFSQAGAEKLFTPSSEQVSLARSTDSAAPGLDVTIVPGKEGYPGLRFTPTTPLNVSDFGHVEAKITNTGTAPLSFSLRLDNKGDWKDEPFNTESIRIKPGETGVVSTIPGYTYGRKPGFKLDASAIVNIQMFSSKSDVQQTFRIEALRAAGPKGEKPPVDPKTLRTEPPKGVILGVGSTLEPEQIGVSGGAKASVSAAGGGQAITIDLPASGSGAETVTVKPKVGRWNLRFYTDIRVKVRNDGQTPITPKLQAVSDGNGNTDLVTGPEILPGKSAEIVIPFSPAVPWTGVPNTGDKPTNWSPPKGSGTVFASDATAGVKIAAAHKGAALLTVESMQAAVTASEVPEWLGKRPPVEGDWAKTLSEEFDGKEINQDVWAIYGPNYWDKKTHWSKDNIILGDGLLRFRFEKKTGFHNDDPKGKQTPYACGFLETYGKWAQRYGYFETRVKLPVAEGLWPTFWLMPDRGPEAGPQWKRQDTGNSGMEFDIMEHLSRWGPYRYNIAHHWDGYQKNHKQNGSSYVYVNPDKDGFMTVGLLWLPGQTRYYCNGKLVGQWDDPRISNVRANIIFETTTGGWDNNSVEDKQLPVDYIVDYVRVWQRKDLASPADGKTPPASQPAGGSAAK